jgi:hypothetical protein
MLGSWFLLQSSVMSRVRYDEETKVLEIEFNSGRVYQYLKVPLFRFQELKSASSAGSYFNSSIKPFYKHIKVG